MYRIYISQPSRVWSNTSHYSLLHIFQSVRLTEPKDRTNRRKFGYLEARTELLTEHFGLGLFQSRSQSFRFGLRSSVNYAQSYLSASWKLFDLPRVPHVTCSSIPPPWHLLSAEWFRFACLTFLLGHLFGDDMVWQPGGLLPTCWDTSWMSY